MCCCLLLTMKQIFVVDSADKARIEIAREELHAMLAEEELKNAVLLVFANKSDLPKAMDAEEITEKLGLNKLRDRTWHVQQSCAIAGDGLLDGLTWLNQNVP